MTLRQLWSYSRCLRHVVCRFLLGPADPHPAGHGLGDGPALDEALRVRGPCAVEGALSHCAQRQVPSGVDLRGGGQLSADLRRVRCNRRLQRVNRLLKDPVVMRYRLARRSKHTQFREHP